MMPVGLFAMVFLTGWMAVPQTPAPLTVYVYAAPNPHGFTDEALQAREDTVRDLLKALTDKKARRVFQVVTRPEDADLQLEVVWRGSLATDERTGQAVVWPGTGVATSTSETVTQDNIRVVLHVGPHDQTFWGVEPGERTILGHLVTRLWSDLAKDTVKDAATWVEQNRAQIDALLVTTSP